MPNPLPFTRANTPLARRTQSVCPVLLTYLDSATEPLSTSDLRQVAQFLAKEFRYRPASAMWEPATWYQEQLGAEVCTLDQADLLRDMTIDRCTAIARGLEHEREVFPGEALIREHVEALSDWIDGIGLVIALLFIFMLAGLAMGPSPATPTPAHSPAAETVGAR